MADKGWVGAASSRPPPFACCCCCLLLQRISYEARSPPERDAIVGKLAFLLHALGEGHKVLRAA